MNRPTDTAMFDQRVADWLEEDPDVAPAQIMETVVAALPSVAQRGGLGPITWSLPRSPRLAYLGVALVALLLMALLGLAVIGRPGPVTRATSPPGLSARFDAPLHFYSINLPPGWRATVGARSESSDLFPGPEGIVEVAFSLIPSGTGQEAWAAAEFAEQVGATPGCEGLDVESYVSQSVGQDFGRLYSAPCLHGWLVMTAVGDRGFDIRFLLRDGADEAAARQLFSQILPAMILDHGPTPPLALSTFTSSRYGYAVAYPTGWTITEAARDLGAFDIPWANGDQIDLAQPAPGTAAPGQPSSGTLDIAAAVLPPGTTLEEFTSRTVGVACGAASGTPVSVDGETGNLVEYSQCYGSFHQWVTLIHEGRGYHVVWLGELEGQGFDRSIFRQILATLRFSAPRPGGQTPQAGSQGT